ncbi:hypothetical protein CS063_11345 [Sporanaerobium hydrogeniformans]|uniref:Uncharacterized protein n=1 Tax=Sporanaerobium hydrogeniformans TaxID=3072179 RepID=A0AC61DBW2_9FIRM|nr:sensor histidine kinase [Sporanaerobium hydrogeniformans]PHV70256.1 hypothetical protein CS063_11345 [Sporanaerobium hydrogeniformans]
MHFQTKIICMYSAFILVIAIILGSLYNHYSIKQYEQVEYKNLKLVAEQLEQNLNESLKQMILITDYILSDIEIIQGIRALNVEESDNEAALNYRNDALVAIRLKLNMDYIRKHFYRVVFFNQRGDIIASNNEGNRIINPSQSTSDITWLKQVENTKGNPVIIDQHKDNWGLKSNVEVFSLVKKVQGSQLGYIEVQKQIEDLKQIFQIARENLGVVVIRDNGNIFYSNLPRDYDAFYQQIVRKLKKDKFIYANPESGNKEMIAFVYCEEAQSTILVTEDISEIKEASAYITPTIILIALCLVAVSLTYIVIVSRHLTKPIRRLREQMENTGLENLKDEISVEQSNDEILALQKSYQKVLTRLDEAITKEKKQSLLQVQAQFDLLQAQVNPHFLYNVLNVISNRGIICGDEVICEMCGSLADMLRYSTSNKNRQATLQEEIKYLEQYFYLLKSRYDYKLSYVIDIQPEVKNQIVPKIVLQQIVENCINHGFENRVGCMEVKVKAWQEGDYWYVCIVDNGEGFKRDILAQLEEKMEEVKKCLESHTSNIQLEIGGMGLINTYARLYLLYGEQLVFELKNKTSGAQVLIGAKRIG